MQVGRGSLPAVELGFPEPTPKRLMWIGSDRIFYAGLLGRLSTRNLGAVVLYVSLGEPIRASLDGGPWETADLAVVPPFVPHRVACDARHVGVMLIEPELVDLRLLRQFMNCHPNSQAASKVVQRVNDTYAWLKSAGHGVEFDTLAFDEAVFGEALATKRLDRRIARVVEQIKREPCDYMSAEDCAKTVNLSFSRFLHLFKAEVGAPFRSFRTWKRARALLPYVNQDANLTHIALDIGYPDSTHFSHSIRQVYGLKPTDIFAGSRRLAIYGAIQPSKAAHARGGWHERWRSSARAGSSAPRPCVAD